MIIKNIMKPWDGNLIVENGLDQSIDIYSIDIIEITMNSGIIDVVNDQQEKVGEIKSELLEYIWNYSSIGLISMIIEKVDEGIVAIDKESRIFYANEMYSKILGVPLGKIIGKQMQQIEPNALLLKVLDDKKEIILEHSYIKSISRYVSGKIYPLMYKGEFYGAVSVFMDATKIEELSQEVDRANQMVFNLENQMLAKEELDKSQIIGSNTNFLNMIYQASIVAKTDAPVIIRGENGVGKELIAKFIHKTGKRASKPLIVVNCAAIPENLIESELFGYEEGSFTGAKHGGKIGKFELANGGTLFLDEIGDMPVIMQPKLLRAIQENEIEKVGGAKNISVDVRIITATNQPLEEMIEQKLFRKDLFYRINTVSLTVPSLKERNEDIGLLANHFLNTFNEKYEKTVVFDKSVLSFFHSYDWPGNVRELKNCIEFGVIMCQNNIMDKSYLTQCIRGNDSNYVEQDIEKFSPMFSNQTLKEAVEKTEKSLIEETLAACENNRTEAMRILDLSRRTFYRKLQDYDIKLK